MGSNTKTNGSLPWQAYLPSGFKQAAVILLASLNPAVKYYDNGILGAFIFLTHTGNDAEKG